VKLLLFSDLHADADAARRLLRLAASADVLVGAGDFGNVHTDVGLCLDVLKESGKPTVLVPGNNETFAELLLACRGWRQALPLHGTAVVVDGLTFFGLGGGVPVTPFGSWSFDLTEERAADLLAPCPPGCVLVTHSPPKGAADRNSRGASLGSEAVRACVEAKRPALVVCGHIHASGGTVADLDGMPVVNAGPAGVMWDITSGLPMR
jgi:Icc-related predicted phosphoesterase